MSQAQFERVVKRGQIYYMHKRPPYHGSREIIPKSGRPGIIVSRDTENVMSGTVEVVYFTSPENIKFMRDTQCSLNERLTIHGIAKCEQIDTIDKDCIGDYVGEANAEFMEKLDIALMNSLGFDENKIRHILSTMSKVDEYIKEDACLTASLYKASQDAEKDKLRQQVKDLEEKCKAIESSVPSDYQDILSQKEMYKRMYEDIIRTLTGKS